MYPPEDVVYIDPARSVPNELRDGGRIHKTPELGILPPSLNSDKKDQFSDQGRSYADKSVSRVIRVFVRPGLGRSSATTCAKLRRAGPEKCFSRLSRDLQGPRAGRAATGPANRPRSNECQS